MNVLKVGQVELACRHGTLSHTLNDNFSLGNFQRGSDLDVQSVSQDRCIGIKIRVEISFAHASGWLLVTFQDVGERLFMGPAFMFEHIKHGHLFCVERIAFDLLQRHGLKQPMPPARCIVGKTC